MIKPNLKAIEKYVKFIEPTDTTGKLRATINIYDEPIMITGEVSIFTTLKIEEEVEMGFEDSKPVMEYIPYRDLFYPNVFTEDEVNELFESIKSNPEKFKKK